MQRRTVKSWGAPIKIPLLNLCDAQVGKCNRFITQGSLCTYDIKGLRCSGGTVHPSPSRGAGSSLTRQPCEYAQLRGSRTLTGEEHRTMRSTMRRIQPSCTRPQPNRDPSVPPFGNSRFVACLNESSIVGIAIGLGSAPCSYCRLSPDHTD